MPNETSIQSQTTAVQEALDGREALLLDLLPSQRAVDRFKRVVVQSLAKNPDLLQADRASIVQAAFEAARLGLEPSGAIGGAHLVRYGSKVGLIVDYRGLVELARRSGEIQDIAAVIVRKSDIFRVTRGTRPGIEHIPDLEAAAVPGEGGEPDMTHVYAVAHLMGGGIQFEVMTKDQIDAIRARAPAANHGPWRTDYEEMAKKTVLRRLCKLLPLTIEAREVIEREYEEPIPVAVEPVSGTLQDRIRERTAMLEDGLPDIPQDGEPVAYDEPALVPDELPE